MLNLSHVNIRFLVLVAIVTAMLGCSASEEKRPLYLSSKSIAALKIPARLDTPAGDEVFALPYLGALEGKLEAIDPRPPVDLPTEADPDQVAE